MKQASASLCVVLMTWFAMVPQAGAAMVCNHRDVQGQEPPNRFVLDLQGPRVFIERTLLQPDGQWRVETEFLIDSGGVHRPRAVAADQLQFRFRDDQDLYGITWNAGVLASGAARVDRATSKAEFVSVATVGQSKTLRLQMDGCRDLVP